MSASAWDDPQTSILLLEWRAAHIVRARAEHADDPDASTDQRVSRAVSEAFIAAQVGEMLASSPLKGDEARVVALLFKLVCLRLSLCQ